MPKPKRSHDRSPGQTQISIAIPKALLAEVDECAEHDDRNRSSWIVATLRARVEKIKAERALNAEAPKLAHFPSTATSDTPRVGLNESPVAPLEAVPTPVPPNLTPARPALRKSATREKRKS